MNTNTRRDMNKATNRESFRDRMNFTVTWNKIQEIEGELMAMCMPQTVFTEDGDLKVVLISPDTARAGTLKIVLDSKWKAMAKVLPDLKAVDQHKLLGAEQEEELPIMGLVELKKRLRLKLLSDKVKPVGEKPEAPEWMK